MLELRGRLILCRYLETEDTLPGGRIALLQGSKDAITSQQGVVEAVGPGERDEEGDWVPMDPDLKPGAWVLHRAFARKPWSDDQHFLLHADDIVAILASNGASSSDAGRGRGSHARRVGARRSRN